MQILFSQFYYICTYYGKIITSFAYHTMASFKISFFTVGIRKTFNYDLFNVLDYIHLYALLFSITLWCTRAPYKLTLYRMIWNVYCLYLSLSQALYKLMAQLYVGWPLIMLNLYWMICDLAKVLVWLVMLLGWRLLCRVTFSQAEPSIWSLYRVTGIDTELWR